MANKRQLKKSIKYVCGELAGECIVARDLLPDMDFEKMNDIIFTIADLQASTLERVSFSFDKKAKDFASAHEFRKAHHAYNAQAYKTLRKDFNDKVQEIIKSMNAQLTPAQKEANKAAAED